jgi:hypothetical protein
MKDKDIYDKWTTFVNDSKYKDCLMNCGAKWLNDLQKLKDFIDENGRPNSKSKIQYEKHLGKWIGTQQTNYKKKEQIMKEKDIYDK